MKPQLFTPFIIVLAMFLAMPLLAGGSQEESDLEAELVDALQDEGLTEEEAKAVAEAAAELENEGFSRSEVATATLDAVDELQSQIQDWQEGELDSENLGNVVKNTVSDAATAAAQEAGEAEGDAAVGGSEPPAQPDDRSAKQER